ncbi:hypothetical protein SLE2022_282430 [Rubroshorea leprosula]
MELFSPQGLNYVANAICALLALDKATQNITKVDFVKVFLEIDVASTQDHHPTEYPVDIEECLSTYCV